jgi:uncharacterized delta-60 repeat protein
MRFLPTGALDPTFGVGGVVDAPSLLAQRVPEALEIAPDGKLVAAGWYRSVAATHWESLFLRFLVDGSRDPSFGDFGQVHGDQYLDTDFHPTSVTVLPDGRVRGCGRLLTAFTQTAGFVRGLQADGRPDLDYGDLFGVEIFSKLHVICDQNGEGTIFSGVDTAAGKDLVVRAGASGLLDRNFVDDRTLGNTELADADLHEVAIRPDGSVVQVLSDRGQLDRSKLRAFLATGAVDTGFGQNGRVTVGEGGQRGGDRRVQLRALEPLPDGRILAAGSFAGNLAVTRLLPSGGLDPTFASGTDYWLSTAPGLAAELALGPDGAIAVLGKGGPTGRDLLLARMIESACHADGFTACLLNHRYQLTATFRTPQGASGHAKVVQLTPDTAVLWFFSPSNVELTVKVLDGCGVNGRIWVFSSGLTNVEVDLRVRDSLTGEVREYHNPVRTDYAPVFDTRAFAACP